MPQLEVSHSQFTYILDTTPKADTLTVDPVTPEVTMATAQEVSWSLSMKRRWSNTKTMLTNPPTMHINSTTTTTITITKERQRLIGTTSVSTYVTVTTSVAISTNLHREREEAELLVSRPLLLTNQLLR
jgi:hypothetical protein